MELDVETRRIAFFALLGVAALAVVASLTVTLLALPSAGTWLLVSVVVLVLALAGEVLLLVYGESGDFDENGGKWYDWESEAEVKNTLLLRCSGCKETFRLHDTGERPLRHACPHCGRNGVLKGDPKPSAPPESPGA